MRLYKRGKTWFVDVNLRGVKRQRLSTGCQDKKAAEIVARRIEQEHADPAGTAVRATTLEQALTLLISKREQQADLGKRSPETAKMYRKKSGHLMRLLGQEGEYRPFRIGELSASHVDAYIRTRRDEGAAGNTIAKEIVTLRGGLKLAARAGLWDGNLLAVLPAESLSDYRPRTRWLTEDEVDKLLHALGGDRAARVAYIVATSANRNETNLAQRGDVSPARDFVEIHGTKTAWRSRRVPMVVPLLRRYLDFALEHAAGEGDALFKPWGNMNRDILVACKRVGIERCSPNDLRRTCATWLRGMGLQPDLIAAVLGHRDTRMVERVYGRLAPEVLAERMKQSLRPSQER